MRWWHWPCTVVDMLQVSCSGLRHCRRLVPHIVAHNVLCRESIAIAVVTAVTCVSGVRHLRRGWVMVRALNAPPCGRGTFSSAVTS